MSCCRRIDNDTANCLSSTLCCAVILFIFSLVIFAIVINSPKELNFTIADASLTRFNFVTANTNTNNTLFYSMALNITIRNPNKKGGLYYDRFQVIANYRKKTFAVVTSAVTPFYQGPKNTTVLHFVLEGQQAVQLEKGDIEWYGSVTSSGIYSIDVSLALQLRNVKFRNTKSHLEPPQIYCDKLKVPLHSNNVTYFKAIECNNVYIFTSRYDHEQSI
ncbi:hypothetical protein TIFTF001_008645 [Ficus carica]|uniref:Late embryogenesis abundant protein LEA-2 subgroup domain-containing protein n=1 Tax=Ficus carica TaxID=3494 RepID=A0AA88D1X4_FICCA|nr:hypothetical protein TIFTF001_008645 [Ficus carica]